MEKAYNESNLILIKVQNNKKNNHLQLEWIHWQWKFECPGNCRYTIGWDPWEGKRALDVKYKWED